MSTEPFLRVEKGSADPDELGALTVLLLARQRIDPSPAPRPAARWRRLERRPAFTDPRAWTSATP